MSDAPAAPPPAAPPAAPAGPPAVTPPSHDAPQSATVQQPFNDAFADLERMISEPEPKPSDTPPPDKPVKDKAPEPPAPKPDKPPETPTEKMPPKQLREAYNALKAKLAAIEKERDEFKTKAETPREDPEKKTLAEKLTAREKRLAELEETLRFTDFQKSEEYNEKWYQPFLESYTDGRDYVASIKVVGEDGEMRKGTPEDFDRYMQILDEDQAADFAEHVFGNKRSMVENHRMQVMQKNNARRKAIEDHAKHGSEREKAKAEQMEAQRKMIGEVWQNSNKQASEKYPHWFAPTDGDEKGNELLSRGMHLADRAFSSGQPLADGDKPLSPKEMVLLHNAIRNKAGGFDRLAFRFSQAEKKIKSLEAKIAEYEKSEPGAGEGKRGEAAPAEDWETQLEKLAKS